MEPDPGDTPSVEGDDFRASYAESLPHVYGYLLRRVGGNAALAEDLTQETYVAAVKELVRRRQPINLTVPWLIGVARHKLVDHFRSQAREERKLVLVAGEAGVDHPPVWSDITLDQLLTSLGTLPPLQRAAIGLRYLDDLPVADVARLLGRTIHATESLLARGRDGLRRHYLEHADG